MKWFGDSRILDDTCKVCGEPFYAKIDKPMSYYFLCEKHYRERVQE